VIGEIIPRWVPAHVGIPGLEWPTRSPKGSTDGGGYMYNIETGRGETEVEGEISEKMTTADEDA